MNKYQVRLIDNTTETVTAAKMMHNGAGLFFYDETGELVASYIDGSHKGGMKLEPETKGETK